MNHIGKIRNLIGSWAANNQKTTLFVLAPLIIYGFYPIGVENFPGLVTMLRAITVMILIALLLSPLKRNQVEVEKPKEEEQSGNDKRGFNKNNNIDLFRKTPDNLPIKTLRDSEKSFQQYLTKILSIIKKTFAAHSAVIYLRDRELDKFRLKCIVSDEEKIASDTDLDKDNEIIEKIIDEESSFLFNETDEYVSDLPYYTDKVEMACYIAAPVYVEEELDAILFIDSNEHNAFSEDYIGLIDTYCGIISETVVNYNTLFEFGYSAQLFSFFYEVSRGLISNLKFAEILDLLLSVMKDVISYDRLTITEYKTGSDQAKIIRVEGQEDDFTENTTFPIKEGLNGWVIRKCTPIRIPDLEKDDHFLPRFSSQEKSNKNLRSFLAAPISYHDVCFGAISIESLKTDNFSERDEKILTMLANNFGVALERSHALQQLEMQATTDELTNVYNYRSFMQRISEEIERSYRYKSSFTLLMLDIDYFKSVNDKYGHLAGDKVLSLVAVAIKKSTRNVDFVCRYGGEEFCVILVETGMQKALLTAERIRKKIKNLETNFQDQIINVTISIGAVKFPNSSKDYEKLISEADTALYRAKAKGRDCVVA
ncbi:sensor domain-containing diguanylate cyclase, partial [candidate division KSB1 bacterium]|nr:sensor domain-containing diguanylate cyclase [candidate division KSB1 bacterium]